MKKTKFILRDYFSRVFYNYFKCFSQFQQTDQNRVLNIKWVLILLRAIRYSPISSTKVQTNFQILISKYQSRNYYYCSVWNSTETIYLLYLSFIVLKKHDFWFERVMAEMISIGRNGRIVWPLIIQNSITNRLS